MIAKLNDTCANLVQDCSHRTMVTDFWLSEGRAWDWTNRIVNLPKSP